MHVHVELCAYVVRKVIILNVSASALTVCSDCDRVRCVSFSLWRALLPAIPLRDALGLPSNFSQASSHGPRPLFCLFRHYDWHLCSTCFYPLSSALHLFFLNAHFDSFPGAYFLEWDLRLSLADQPMVVVSGELGVS